MALAPYRIQLLDATLDRSGFSSGPEPLDRYFQQQVTQDTRRRVTSCFVALDSHQYIAGFYTLASSSVVLSDLPDSITKKLPRYPSVPAVRMGRLAVDRAAKGQGLGAALLANALERASEAEIAAFALVVDAKDQAACNFYLHHGFMPFANTLMSLFLPLATVKPLLQS